MCACLLFVRQLMCGSFTSSAATLVVICSTACNALDMRSHDRQCARQVLHQQQSSAVLAMLQGILLADQSEKLDSMNLLRVMSPIAVAMLLPAVTLLEPTGPIVAWRLLLAQPQLAVLLISNASLAYVVNFANFQITHYTSALTLQVDPLLGKLPTLPVLRVHLSQLSRSSLNAPCNAMGRVTSQSCKVMSRCASGSVAGLNAQRLSWSLSCTCLK